MASAREDVPHVERTQVVCPFFNSREFVQVFAHRDDPAGLERADQHEGFAGLAKTTTFAGLGLRGYRRKAAGVCTVPRER